MERNSKISSPSTLFNAQIFYTHLPLSSDEVHIDTAILPKFSHLGVQEMEQTEGKSICKQIVLYFNKQYSREN